MEQRAFGRSGLTVPTVGMGTWATLDVRGGSEEPARHAVVRAAVEAGTTLFDTSPMYGESERVLGGALAGVRGEVLVADKVWAHSVREGREQIRRALDWYGGKVDVYQVHNLLAWRDHLPVLEELRERGSVRVIGATHYAHSAFPELMAVMRTGRIGMIQIPYNAADRVVEREVLPLADELGLGVLVMEPLGRGELARRAPSARDLAPLAEFGVATWAQALLKWILSDPRVHCVIPATRRLERVAENAAAGNPPWFDPDTREYVARLAAR
ncbi:MAG TPA: aldo/keto reductase [Longimicrobium sp.]|nr:aldo/keto reductase [Longimicrobium sp.]